MLLGILVIWWVSLFCCVRSSWCEDNGSCRTSWPLTVTHHIPQDLDPCISAFAIFFFYQYSQKSVALILNLFLSSQICLLFQCVAHSNILLCVTLCNILTFHVWGIVSLTPILYPDGGTIPCPLPSHVYSVYSHFLCVCVCGNISVQIDEIYRTENMNADETYCSQMGFCANKGRDGFCAEKVWRQFSCAS